MSREQGNGGADERSGESPDGPGGGGRGEGKPAYKQKILRETESCRRAEEAGSGPTRATRRLPRWSGRLPGGVKVKDAGFVHRAHGARGERVS
jgi:hypothetical protein